jgi:hypothetical protein
MTPQTKRCTGRCGRTLPLDAEHFNRHARSSGGFHSRCKECRAADRRDERLVKRLGTADVRNVADAYRKGREDGVEAAYAYLRRVGRLLPDDEALAAEARRQAIAAKAEEALRAKVGGD